MALVGSALALVAGCPGGDGQQNTFSAQLSGNNEVPPVNTTATGSSEVEIGEGDTAITYRLEAYDIANVTAAHIHVGAAGTNGPIIFFLFDAATQGAFTSPVTGTLTEADFIPAGGLTTFEDAITAIRAGNTYVNVHTQANPNGEIRGQLTPSN